MINEGLEGNLRPSFSFLWLIFMMNIWGNIPPTPDTETWSKFIIHIDGRNLIWLFFWTEHDRWKYLGMNFIISEINIQKLKIVKKIYWKRISIIILYFFYEMKKDKCKNLLGLSLVPALSYLKRNFLGLGLSIYI